MVNEIPTLLANHGPGKDDMWYIDPNFNGVTIPRNLRDLYRKIVGDYDKDKTVMQLMSLLNCVDIQPYLQAFDTRLLFDNISGATIYDLYKNFTDTNLIANILDIRNISSLFSGDKYIQSLSELYYKSNESVIRACAVILALAYKLKEVFIKEGGK